ncbi:MAG: erythromycin esterase family protein [Flavobacteriales bacterium]|nr:erythromycin esterase family protein [Flavobacteriales bacterium]
MKRTYQPFYFVFSLIVLYSCASPKEMKIVQKNAVIALPDDLTELSGDDFSPIMESLESAKIIGVTECVHEMAEPFYFRNALIKRLVTEQKIGAIAIESGFSESRLCYDFILGKDISLDSVMNNGFSCMFETIDANRELLLWLRNYNSNKSPEEQVHFYGFDVPGCPPNPFLEDAYAGFDYVFDYLNEVNPLMSKQFQEKIDVYRKYLKIEPNPTEETVDYQDLDSAGWENLEHLLKELETEFIANKMEFVHASSELDYQWAFRSVSNARANVNFLRSIGNSDYTYDVRDCGQFENVQWIQKKEGKKRLLLFAHSVHLMKEIHSDNPAVLAHPMCGEYLGEEYGDDYVVIGNFYRKLDWLDGDPLELEEGALGVDLSKLGSKNYLINVDDLSEDWKKEWFIRNLNSGDELLTDLDKSVDIIYFNDTQTTLFRYEEDEK